MDEKNHFLQLKGVRPRVYGLEYDPLINWEIKRGEQWAVVGLNGAGKTFLADFICGKYAVREGKINYGYWSVEKAHETGKFYASELIRKVSFESAYLLADYKNMYYQQRFHAMENETTPTVRELITSIPLNEEEKHVLVRRLNLEPLYEKHLIMLSSGELRRVLIANVLMQKPELLIFDNPFIGLDKEMMAELNLFFTELSKFQQMVFLVPALIEIPECVTNVLPVKNMEYGPAMTKDEFLASPKECLVPQKSFSADVLLPETVVPSKQYESVVRLEDINLSYKDRVVFSHLNWEIKKGEKWALLGPNGSGKSTLLSLMVGDNPKAYSQNITIFDKRRGTGESIWDIKRPIGYISSEMHLFFNENQPCSRIVGSGFFDTIGLFRKCNEEQERLCYQWMDLLGIGYLKDKSFLKISGGEQRLVLFARTMVKNPDFLILDEPLHGLDIPHKKRARQLIEKFCEQPGKSLIYVTHRREEIPSAVDQFYELKNLGNDKN
ncbi:MAG: ATP-binding cassette domain-containing protein [Paludibacteraceae bacterium]|nr:ATP-binding cassette domain-containing protein [Paludibacteraceae bacterium]